MDGTYVERGMKLNGWKLAHIGPEIGIYAHGIIGFERYTSMLLLYMVYGISLAVWRCQSTIPSPFPR